MSLNGLPENWEVRKLGDVCEFHYGKGLTKKNRDETGAYDVYGSNGVVGRHSGFLVREPCIIVGRKGAAGEVHLSTNPSWPIDTTYFVKKPASFELKFLFYQLRTLRLASLEKSTAIPGLNRNDAYDKNVVIPPLDEQERIVAKIEELFSELDAGVESLKKAQAQLKTYRQAVLKSAFGGKLTNAEDKNDELPDGWRWVRLGDHAFVTKLAGFEFTKHVKYREKGEIPVIRAQNVTKDRFIPRNFTYVDREVMEKLPRSQVFGGEVLMVFVGAGLGNVGILPKGGEYFLGPNVAKIALNPEFNNKYIVHFLSSAIGFGNVTGNSKATAQGSISMANIRDVVVPLCSIEEQQKVLEEIESRLSVCDKLEETIAASLKQSEALRQSILKQAFEGKLVQ